MASSPELWVTALGAVTSLGPTAVASASAFRAGLARARPVLGAGDAEGPPPIGRPIAGFTDGFAQFGLWLRLATGSLSDLAATAPLTDETRWRHAALIACLPEPSTARFALPDDDRAGMLKTAFFEPLLELTGLPIPPSRCEARFGRCAPAEALARAQQMFAVEPTLERVLVVAADSTCDAQSLGWLAQVGRLKTAENPVGLIPGEAGVAILVERATAARARQAPALALLHTPRFAKPLGDDAPLPAVGRQLAEVVQHAIAAAGATPVRDAYLDQNGEPWQAEAYGHCLVHLQANANCRELVGILPATSFGELGASASLFAVVAAARAFVRGYARSPAAVIISHDEHHATAAFVVQRP